VVLPNFGPYKHPLYHKFEHAVKTPSDRVVRRTFIACYRNV